MWLWLGLAVINGIMVWGSARSDYRMIRRGLESEDPDVRDTARGLMMNRGAMALLFFFCVVQAIAKAVKP